MFHCAFQNYYALQHWSQSRFGEIIVLTIFNTLFYYLGKVWSSSLSATGKKKRKYHVLFVAAATTTITMSHWLMQCIFMLSQPSPTLWLISAFWLFTRRLNQVERAIKPLNLAQKTCQCCHTRCQQIGGRIVRAYLHFRTRFSRSKMNVNSLRELGTWLESNLVR